MDNVHSFWQLGDELRGQTKTSEDHKWLMAASKLGEQTRSKGEGMKNLDFSKATTDLRPRDRFGFQEENKLERLNFNMNMLSLDSKGTENLSKSAIGNNAYNTSSIYPKSNVNVNRMENTIIIKSNMNNLGHKEPIGNRNNNNNNNDNANDKRFKTLVADETLPRNEILGGYIFVCNNDTMQENLKRQLFGNCSSFIHVLYEISISFSFVFEVYLRAITSGLPLFLYNYTTHQLHGIFEASCFGGSSIDPMAWEDKKCKGESRFPAQTLELLDLYEQAGI